MLSTFGTSSSSHQEDEDEEPPPPPPPPDNPNHHHRSRQIRSAPPPIHMRQLLITCAELVSRSDLSAAHCLISILSTNSSPHGDCTERLVHQFTKALVLRLNAATSSPAGGDDITAQGFGTHDDDSLIQSSYLSLNQITPFIRFTHLTANQAILEAIDGRQAIHILDFEIMHGLQWPPLMQAMADRCPPPTLRITATGSDAELLRRTGDRLAKFAHSLGLKFKFNPLTLRNNNEDLISVTASVLLIPEETLVVNCVHYLHRLLEGPDRLLLFLRRIKAMCPAVLTVAEREANHNVPTFRERFAEALHHYAAVFDSLEATLPPNSPERTVVEQIWFGREIADIVGENRRQIRHQRFRAWKAMLRNTGFSNVPLSPFALSQAKLLLRLHYPSEGYQLHFHNDSLFLGWQNKPLFSVSSWH